MVLSLVEDALFDRLGTGFQLSLLAAELAPEFLIGHCGPILAAPRTLAKRNARPETVASLPQPPIEIASARGVKPAD
jgi:hypothetical protein